MATTRRLIDTRDAAAVIDIIEDLFSYSTVRWRRILEYYYFEDATLTSPIMSTEGIDNIQ